MRRQGGGGTGYQHGDRERAAFASRREQVFIADKDAASELTMRDYYSLNHYAAKPAAQKRNWSTNEAASTRVLLPSRLITHRHRPRAELQPVHELQSRHAPIAPGTTRRPVARWPGLHHELVLIDQSPAPLAPVGASLLPRAILTRLPLELLNAFTAQIPRARAPRSNRPGQGARHDILLCRVDRPGEGFHPIGHPIRPHSRPRGPRHAASIISWITRPKEGIGLREVLGRVTMRDFVRDYCPMISTRQCDVDGYRRGRIKRLKKYPA